MTDGDGQLSSWAQYIRAATPGPPGMTVAELARRSGINRVTIFQWRRQLAGQGKRVTVDSVNAIARAIGDKPELALRAAGNAVHASAHDGITLSDSAAATVQSAEERERAVQRFVLDAIAAIMENDALSHDERIRRIDALVEAWQAEFGTKRAERGGQERRPA